MTRLSWLALSSEADATITFKLATRLLLTTSWAGCTNIRTAVPVNTASSITPTVASGDFTATATSRTTGTEASSFTRRWGCWLWCDRGS